MNIKEFDVMSRKVFYDCYPAIAKQIVENTGVKDGISLDVGGGAAYLAIEIAKISNLQVYDLDLEPEMIHLANKNIETNKMQNQVKAFCGDVHSIPFKDESFDIVISRGSMFLWDDLASAYDEIYRVLKKGGIAYLGSGFGSKDIYESIPERMKNIGLEWRGGMMKKVEGQSAQLVQQGMKKSIIKEYYIRESEEEGFWVFFEK